MGVPAASGSGRGAAYGKWRKIRSEAPNLRSVSTVIARACRLARTEFSSSYRRGAGCASSAVLGCPARSLGCPAMSPGAENRDERILLPAADVTTDCAASCEALSCSDP